MNDTNHDKPPEEPEEKLAEGTLISHLLELRTRLIRAGIAWVIALIPCAYYANRLFEFIARPLLQRMAGTKLIATKVMSPFMTPFKLSMFVAFFVAAPFILYQIWSFVAPGLYKHERRFAVPLLVSSVLLFYAGNAFAYVFVFPVIFQFFLKTTPPGVEMRPDIGDYLNFVMRLFLGFGVAFEVPIAVVLLVLTGLVSLDKLKANRGYVLIGIFIVAAILTPPDAVSMTIMALPMYALYEGGIIMAAVMLRMRQKREEAEGKSGS
jgi:sec-independent protein translocase protein TatC